MKSALRVWHSVRIILVQNLHKEIRMGAPYRLVHQGKMMERKERKGRGKEEEKRQERVDVFEWDSYFVWRVKEMNMRGWFLELEVVELDKERRRRRKRGKSQKNVKKVKSRMRRAGQKEMMGWVGVLGRIQERQLNLESLIWSVRLIFLLGIKLLRFLSRFEDLMLYKRRYSGPISEKWSIDSEWILWRSWNTMIHDTSN